jgi:hypothetical protein
MSFLNWFVMVWGFAKWRIITIPKAIGIDAENQILINHIPIAIGSVCGALNRHFCKTAVIGSGIV